MVLVTLRRHAQEVATNAECGICGRTGEAHMRDHLLVGQPGSAGQEYSICAACGDVLADLVQKVGPQVTLLLQEDRQDVGHFVGVPKATQATRERAESQTDGAAANDAASSGLQAEVDEAEKQLRQEAHTLAQAERTLRTQADRLTRVKEDLKE